MGHRHQSLSQRPVLVVWDNFESTLPVFQKGQPQSTDEEISDAVESPLEFGNEERSRLQQLYRELTDGNPQGRLLVTCRPYAYEQEQWRIQRFNHAALADFGAGQIRRFVDRWYENRG